MARKEKPEDAIANDPYRVDDETRRMVFDCLSGDSYTTMENGKEVTHTIVTPELESFRHRFFGTKPLKQARALVRWAVEAFDSRKEEDAPMSQQDKDIAHINARREELEQASEPHRRLELQREVATLEDYFRRKYFR